MVSPFIQEIEQELDDRSNYETLSKKDRRDIILYEILPTLTEEGNLEAVKDVLSHYKLDFLDAGIFEYLSPEDLSLDNLLTIACQNNHGPLIAFFIRDLQQRGLDPYDYTHYEDCVRKYLRSQQKAAILLMRQKVPNDIAFHVLPQYLQPENDTLFSQNEINRLRSRRTRKQGRSRRNRNRNRNRNRSRR